MYYIFSIKKVNSSIEVHEILYSGLHMRRFGCSTCILKDLYYSRMSQKKNGKNFIFNCAKQDLEFSFNITNKEDGSDRAKAKKNVLYEQNIRKQFGLNYKN